MPIDLATENPEARNLTAQTPRLALPAVLGAALAIMLIAANPAVAQDDAAAVDLRPAWEAGQTARYEVWTRRDRETSMSVGSESQQMSMSMVTEGEVTWTVDRVNADGSASCTMVMDWAAMTLTGDDGQQQIVDTRQGSSDIPPMHEVLQAVTGTPLRVEVAGDGTILSVAGGDAVRSQITVQELAPDERDYIRSAAGLVVLTAAPDQARPGQRWNTRHAWNHEAGTMHHDVTYTLDTVGEIEGVPVATVLTESQLNLEVDQSELPPEAPPIDIRLMEGTQQGQVLYDLNRREAVGRNSIERTTIEVTINMPEQTLHQRNSETVHSQVLRIAEGESSINDR